MKLLITSIIFFSLTFMPKSTSASPVAPPECSGMTFTSTVIATGPVTWVPGTGMILVIGLPNANNTIAVPNATQSCIVGGSRTNTLVGGPGDDVIIGRGTQNSINGEGGNDTCYGTLMAPPHPVNIVCETVLP